MRSVFPWVDNSVPTEIRDLAIGLGLSLIATDILTTFKSR
jgi:hypothetical protein